jgi:hypothetical protein
MSEKSASSAAAVRPARYRLWPLWGAVAGILGEIATIVTDVRSPREIAASEAGQPYTVTSVDMPLLDGQMLTIGFVFGFAAVVALLVFHAAWRRHVETRYADSIAARVVSAGLLASAGSAATPVNPQQLLRVQLASDRVLHLVLGGTARPASTQRAGHYSARIVIIVSQPGT